MDFNDWSGAAVARFSGLGQTSAAATASATPPSLSDEVAFISGITSSGQVGTTSFWSWDGNNPATYSPPYSQVSKWNASHAGTSTAGTPGGTVTFYFDPASNWTATEKQVLQAGLALWSEVANISFVQTTSKSAAEVDFVRGSDGSAETTNDLATTARYGATGIPEPTSTTISIDTSVAGFGPIDGSFTDYGGYPLTTLIHEEGHMLGLGHAGPYDGDVDATTQQYSAYDTLQWTVMSYIQPSDSALYKSSYPVQSNWGTSQGQDGHYYHDTPTTPMALDILAAQRLYGLPTSTPLSGGQVFGFHCNVVGPTEAFFDFSKNTKPVVTLWDEGKGNTLDLSGYSTGSTVNLNAGSFSSVAGLTNDLCIAFNTAIDTAIGGSGNDKITANNDGDHLVGGAGNDTLIGGSGADTLDGGTGNDTLTGGGGADVFVADNSGGQDVITDFNTAQDRLDLTAISTLPTISSVLADASQSGANTVITLGGGASITLDGVSLASLTVHDFLTSASASEVAGADADFSGDGKADLLFLSSAGSLVLWSSQASALTYTAATVGTPASNLQLQLAGDPQDFNGDGLADLLFRRSDGAMVLWDSKTGGGFTSVSLPLVTSDMQVVGAGDFDGDGASDILWRKGNGDLIVWQHPGTGTFTRTDLGIVDPSLHVAAVGDFNGDGKADILFETAAGTTQLWLSGGTAFSFTKVSLPTVGSGWHIEGAADFNGDGKADLFLRSDSGADMLWLSTGTAGTYTQQSLASFATTWSVHEIADFSGDGRPDILWESTAGSLVLWTEKAGAVSFTPASIGAVSTDWHLV